MPYADPVKRVFTKKQKENNASKHNIWLSNNKEKVAISKKAWRIKNENVLKNIKYQRERRQNLRKQLYDMMGNKCVCCGEKDSIYFHIDHVKNDGNLDRPLTEKKDKGTYVKAFCLTTKQYLETPERFQLLCANCNWAKHRNGGKLYKPNRSLNPNE